VLPSEPPASLSSATSTVFKNEMNHKYSFILASALALSFCANVFAQAQDTNQSATNTPTVNAEQAEQTSENPWEWSDNLTPRPGGMQYGPIVSFEDVILKSNDVAESVVVIGANAKIDGRVRHAVVVVGGDITV